MFAWADEWLNKMRLVSNEAVCMVSEDGAFLSHRLHIAEKAVAKGYSVAVLTKVPFSN